MNNSLLETSLGGTPARTAPLHGTRTGSPADRPARLARVRFLTESAAYLGLAPGRDELVRRFLRQTAGKRATGQV